MIGQAAPTDPLAAYAQRTTELEAQVAELKRRLSVPYAAPLALVDSGTYTPTLTGMVAGTGGSPANTAIWVYTGGPNTGDIGHLHLEWLFRFGSSGQTFPTAPTISLPSGFNFVSVDSNRPIGQCSLTDDSASAASRLGQLTPQAAGTFRVRQGGHSGGFGGLTTTSPFTWASNDSINGALDAYVVRV